MEINKKDAIRIKIRKRINPKKDNYQDYFIKLNDYDEPIKISQDFYMDNSGKNEGGKFYAISHFTDIFIDRVSDTKYFNKSLDEYQPVGANRKVYSLSDLIIPRTNRLYYQNEYEVQYLYLSYSLSHFKKLKHHTKKTDFINNNFLIEEEDLENAADFKCFLVSGIKLLNHIDDNKESFEIQLQNYLTERVKGFLIKNHPNEAFSFEVRASLGFGDYCFLTRASSFDVLLDVYHEISHILLSNFGNLKTVKDYDFSILKYTYSIPGVQKYHYDEFVDEWNQNSPTDGNHKSIHLTVKYSEAFQYMIDSLNPKSFYYIFGNYDFMIFDKFPSLEEMKYNWRTKSRLLIDISKEAEFYRQYSKKAIFDEVEDEFWYDFLYIKTVNEQIGYLDLKKILTNIHILSLEYHINLYNRHRIENSISDTLLIEWKSILENFINFTKHYLEVLYIKYYELGDDFDSNNFYDNYYSTINNLRLGFEKALLLINRSVRHWVIGSKSHIEFTGTDNVFHFGNTAKIYTVYTKILNQIQAVFYAFSCLPKHLEVDKTTFDEDHEKNFEFVNFFLVPDNTIRTYSALLFPNLMPDQGRLISVNLSTEIIFNFRMLGLMMHEIGQFICNERPSRNLKFRELITKSFSSGLSNYLLPINYQDDEFSKHPKRNITVLEQTIFDILYIDISKRIFEIVSDSIELIISEKENKKKYKYINSPMGDFSNILYSIFSVKSYSFDDDIAKNLSPYQSGSINLDKNFWKQVIESDDSTKNDIKNIILEIPELFRKIQIELNYSVELFYEYRNNLMGDLYQNDDDINKIIKIIDQKMKDVKLNEFNCCSNYFKQLYKMKLSIQDLFDEQYLLNPKNTFIVFEERIKEFITQNKDKFKSISFEDIKVEDELLNAKLTNFDYEYNEYFQQEVSKIISEFITLDSDIYQYLTNFIFNFYLPVFLFEKDDLLKEKNRSFNKNLNNLNKQKLLQSKDDDLDKVLKKLKEVINNKRVLDPRAGILMDEFLSSNFIELSTMIQETKADYFMIRILKMSNSDYFQQFNYNTDPCLSHILFKKQQQERYEILTIANAFDHSDQSIKKTINKNVPYYQTIKGDIAQIIKQSVDPVVEEFSNSEIITACQDVFHNCESQGISKDLEFISTILNSKIYIPKEKED